uniref:Putative ribonuclease H-like domain-containing protein n=1 Tax=Tanacetum cinerariifolium TaxID=118510 RepID=A0A6L2KY22_TANCI|nr:putative ribonuclease H-like domain-containing protein [Tanacetum cinerariifolium]
MQGDNPIDAINKMMSFLSTFITSHFPTTNNQLRNSSKPRQQETIHDGRVTVQPVQRRQSSYAIGTSRTRANISGTRGNNSSQKKVVKCFNYQGEGHMARQCLKPKRKRDDTWFREKVLLVKAQGSGKVLNEEELEFLADPGVAEDVLLKVPYSENTHNDMLNQSVQEMSYYEQTHLVNYPENKITSDSNIIPYSQYLLETQNAAVHDTNSSAQQDAMILSVFEQLLNLVTNCNKVNKDHLIANESLSAELEGYKERVNLLEERQNVDLKLSDEQAFRLQTSHPNTDQSDPSPVKIEAPRELPKMIQVTLNTPVKNIRIDNGTEFVNQTLRSYYESVGISHETSIARSLQQNGVIKRQNHTLVEAAQTMLIYAKAYLFLLAEAVATACYIKKRSIIRCRHGKTPYELLHDKKPDLSYLHVFGTLCYPNNDSEDLGKLQAKADIGPGLQSMTLATSSSRLVSNPILQQLCNPPPKDDWDCLFQPMFDEYFIPPTIVVSPVPVAVAPRAIDLADSPVSTSIDQDAPSTRPSSNVRPIHTSLESLGRWTKDHPIENMIGDPSYSVSIRKNMNPVVTQQVALDNSLFTLEKRLKIERCISSKTTRLDRLKESRAQILWGMYNQKNVDYVALFWEDFMYQADNKEIKLVKKAKTVKRPAKKSTTVPTASVVIRDTPDAALLEDAQLKKFSGKVGKKLTSFKLVAQVRELILNQSKDENDDVNDDDNANDDESKNKDDNDYDEKEHDEENESDDDYENMYEEVDDDLYKDVDVRSLGAQHEKERKGDEDVDPNF